MFKYGTLNTFLLFRLQRFGSLAAIHFAKNNLYLNVIVMRVRMLNRKNVHILFNSMATLGTKQTTDSIWDNGYEARSRDFNQNKSSYFRVKLKIIKFGL